MLASYAQTVGGYATLLKVGERRINEVTDLINKTVSQYESLAEDVRAAAKGLPNSDATDAGAPNSGSKSGQRSAVQMVSSGPSQSGAGSSNTGPGVPPSIVGTPRPVWPNGVPKV